MPASRRIKLGPTAEEKADPNTMGMANGTNAPIAIAVAVTTTRLVRTMRLIRAFAASGSSRTMRGKL
jgi:hypothetical protein